MTFTLTDLPERIRIRTIVDTTSGCWCCDIALDRDGYSRIGGEGAHRVVYTLLVGEIPPGHQLDHVRDRGCRWRNCIRPEHLEPVTPWINWWRGNSPTRRNAVKTSCGHCGQEYDLFNTYFAPDGSRDCRACIRRRVREYKARLRGAELEMAA